MAIGPGPWRALAAAALLVLGGCGSDSPGAPTSFPVQASNPTWGQWGRTPQHTGALDINGLSPTRTLARMTIDPFVAQEQAETRGALLVHYQAPLVDGNDVYIEVQGGTWIACNPPGSGTPAPCGPDAWNRKTWSERRLTWQGSQLVTAWTFESDWKPEPNGTALSSWEPVFHAAIANGFVYVPGAGGTIHKVDRADGTARARLNPFGSIDPNTYVAGPLTADAQGNIYYNVLRLGAVADPWTQADAQGFLVKVTAGDQARAVPFTSLVQGAPGTCRFGFTTAQLPWPPSPDAVSPSGPCGSQRPGVNVAPAVAPDGTVYTLSRAHFSDRDAFLVAVNGDLTPRWSASLRDRLADGCGVTVPVADAPDTPNACRQGTPANGVDPQTNEPPAGRVRDAGTSSPTVLPDGTILQGAYTRYNGSRGHLLKFGPGGEFIRSYDFGWDITPAVFSHGGTYSIVVKDNHYGGGLYCGGQSPFCAPRADGPYFITQLDANLVPEWSFANPPNFEWCINAPAVDARGTVYANGEDGRLYAIAQGGGGAETAFLKSAIGAAYTPVALGADGRIYAQNGGDLFVLGP